MTAQQDRRDASAQRIPFEAIVEIGGDGAPAFEAESVDVSTGGMHLRTAYLPELGQPLLCRFDDGGGKAVAAEGNVVWREEGARGGEFGVRFTNVDGSSATTLLDMCGIKPSPDAHDAAPPSPPADRGTRVRLHIDGLGSPMKARVRDANPAEVMVGSNLEFLRVGRALELEDVDHGKKRTAHIERVEVEVDPASRVPQLVVALRYDDVPREEIAAAAAAETTPDPVTVDPEDDGARPPMTMRTRSASEAAADPMHDDEVDAANQMKSGLSRAATRVGPAIATFGARAKTTLALLLAKAKERSGRAAEPEAAPRRTTAPPPTGALHATGKRVVRDEAEELVEQTAAPTKKKVRAVAAGAAAGVVAVLLSVAFHKPAAPPPGASAANAPTDSSAAAAVAPAPIPGAPDTVTANVPLFGPTALSTTEPAAPPAPAAAPPAFGAADPGAMAPAAQAPGIAGPAPTGADPAADGESASADEGDSDESSESKPSGEGEKKPAAKKKVASFAHGKVTHPTRIRIHTDGSIAAMHGARSATGFTIVIPGRRATDSAGAIASRDPRIASVHVTNGAKGAEISFQFKDGVPAYAVRAKGKDLQVALGRDEKSAKDSKHAGATAKKTAKHGKKH